jgi:hypothetical protein
LQRRDGLLRAELALDWLPGSERWIPANEVLPLLFDQVYDNVQQHIIDYLPNVMAAHNLSQFRHMLVMYGICLVSGKSLFDLDIPQLLAVLFNLGDRVKAYQLANLYRVDLFVVVLKSPEKFNFCECFVRKNFANHPLKSARLALSNAFLGVIRENGECLAPVLIN